MKIHTNKVVLKIIARKYLIKYYNFISLEYFKINMKED